MMVVEMMKMEYFFDPFSAAGENFPVGFRDQHSAVLLMLLLLILLLLLVLLHFSNFCSKKILTQASQNLPTLASQRVNL